MPSEPASLPRARSNGNAKRPSGFDLLTYWGAERCKVFPDCLPWNTARDRDGDAEAFAAKLTADEIADIEPTMRLALEHIRNGAEGWTDGRLKDPSFAFGRWKSGFTALREEHHGRAPKVAKPITERQRPGQELKVVRT
ncbi:MAG: hypothetical protein MUF54_20355 [Polyangiaceae bacterium]|nr:hypothetical protein [Polyangiaceae bacterium]